MLAKVQRFKLALYVCAEVAANKFKHTLDYLIHSHLFFYLQAMGEPVSTLLSSVLGLVREFSDPSKHR